MIYNVEINMGKMSELHRTCMEYASMLEDGSIDLDEAVEMLIELYPSLSHEMASSFITDVFETY
jgi:hypothetical protein